MDITFENLPKAVSQLYDKLDNIERLLQIKNSEHNIPSDQLLTIRQAAELLSLSVPTIYGLVSKKEIPVNKKGKRLYFSSIELTDWIRSGRKMTLSEINDLSKSYLKSNK
jgi:excisionase family DNA binding protein